MAMLPQACSQRLDMLKESLEQFTAPVYGKTKRTPDTYRTVADHCTGHLTRLVAEYRSVKKQSTVVA